MRCGDVVGDFDIELEWRPAEKPLSYLRIAGRPVARGNETGNWRGPRRGSRAGMLLAEREGFEPSVEFPLHTLSKRAPSTTRPSLRTSGINSLQRALAASQLDREA